MPIVKYIDDNYFIFRFSLQTKKLWVMGVANEAALITAANPNDVKDAIVVEDCEQAFVGYLTDKYKEWENNPEANLFCSTAISALRDYVEERYGQLPL